MGLSESERSVRLRLLVDGPTEGFLGADDSPNRSAFSLFRATMKPVPIGARGEAEESVDFKHTLTAHDSRLPPVYSTPDMVRLMEVAAFHALQPYCEGDEITVGTAIHVEHRAAISIGANVRAEAVVEHYDGRFYTVRVSARDGVQEIGRGTVARAVVSLKEFVAKLERH